MTHTAYFHIIWASFGGLVAWTVPGCSQRAAQPPPQTAAQAIATPAPIARASAPEPKPNERCTLPQVYFDYDSTVIDEPSREATLAAISCYNRNGIPQNVRLAGAADPRGTEDYNLALGLRRAAAMQRLLIVLGVAAARISVTSTGEELATGQDETGWRLDRHVVATDQ